MNEQMMAMLKQLGEKVGQTVEHLWPAAIAYVRADGLSQVLCCGVLALMALVAMAVFFYLTVKDDSDWLFGCILAFVACVVFSGIAADGLPKFLQPEGYLIMSLVKGAK